MDGNNEKKVESSDNIPKVILPPNLNHVPKVTLPQNNNHIPKVTLPQNNNYVPKVTLPQNNNNVPKVTLPQNNNHVPKVILPEKTPEPSGENVSQDSSDNAFDSLKNIEGDNSDEQDFTKKKINKSFIIGSISVLVVFILIITYSSGFIFSKDEKEPDVGVVEKPSEPEINKVPVDINSIEVVSLFSKFRISNNCLYTPDLLNNDNLTKLRIAYENIDVNDFFTASCSQTTCDLNPEYCGETMSQEMEDAFVKNDNEKFKEAERKNTTKVVKAGVLEAKVKELFGSDYNVIHESFGIGGTLPPSCRLMKYESDTVAYYYYNSGECSNICSSDIFEEIKEAYKIDDNLFIVSTYNGDHTRYDLTYEFRVDPETQMFVFKNVTKH